MVMIAILRCSRSVVTPIYMSTSYKKQDLEPTLDLHHYDNPTRTVLEDTLAALDNGKYCLSFPSGTGGQMALITSMSAGDRIICGDNIYTGTIGLFRDIAANFGIETEFVDLTKLDNLRKALTPNTKMVWMETPTNPMMIVLDIRSIVGMCFAFVTVLLNASVKIIFFRYLKTLSTRKVMQFW